MRTYNVASGLVVLLRVPNVKTGAMKVVRLRINSCKAEVKKKNVRHRIFR